jgi:hypothetical protein
VSGAPGYWMAETSGILRPAVEAYLNDEPLTDQHIATLRAYLRQWIGSPVWDRNPHAGPEEHAWLDRMRADIEGLRTRAAIERWVSSAIDGGVDPL